MRYESKSSAGDHTLGGWGQIEKRRETLDFRVWRLGKFIPFGTVSPEYPTGRDLFCKGLYLGMPSKMLSMPSKSGLCDANANRL